MPDELLESHIQNSDRNFFSLNEHGFSLGWFLFTATVWFTIALTAEAALALTGWGVSRLLVKRKRSSRA
jgi:hypothetical protein